MHLAFEGAVHSGEAVQVDLVELDEVIVGVAPGDDVVRYHGILRALLVPIEQDLLQRIIG